MDDVISLEWFWVQGWRRWRVFSVVTFGSESKVSNHIHIWSSGYWLSQIHTQSSWTVKEPPLEFLVVDALLFHLVGLEKGVDVIAIKRFIVGEEMVEETFRKCQGIMLA